MLHIFQTYYPCVKRQNWLPYHTIKTALEHTDHPLHSFTGRRQSFFFNEKTTNEKSKKWNFAFPSIFNKNK